MVLSSSDPAHLVAEVPGRVQAPPPADTLLALGDAWAIGWSSPVLFVLFHRQPSDRDFEHFIAAQAKDIDEWPGWYRRSVVHHATASGSLSAGQRQAAADMVSARRDKLSRICAGYVFCTRSGLTRGVIKVINWLAPPPYPAFQATCVTEGLNLLKGSDPRIEPKLQLSRYRSLFAEFLPAEHSQQL